jgi:flagellar biosynthesis protein FlhA
MKLKFADISIAVIVIAIVLLIIVKVSSGVLDVLLIINLGVSLTILMTTLYIKETLDFSSYPSLLLVTTLFRISLTISSTRLILGNGGEAGSVISTFSSFVTGGNIVVGVVIFLIIMIVQFIVITKGAERVSEVAARFTLDAMPGKQMAIDADLNSGLIDEAQARVRRSKIQREADFYGAMDGAGKFVKGDAIVSLIVVAINVVGGFIIGLMQANSDALTVLQTYTKVTIGEGLVNQIPALLISTATGMIVTRSASENNLSRDLSKQLFSQPLVMMIVGSAFGLFALIPGMPWFPLVLLGGGMGFLGYTMNRNRLRLATAQVVTQKEQTAEAARKPENVVSLLSVDPIEMELGYGLIPLVDDMMDRVIMIRSQLAMDLGVVIPSIRLRDNVQLNINEYIIKIKGYEVARGEVMADHVMAMNPGNARGTIKGIDTIEPTFGLPAMWITKAERERAELLGYTIVDPPAVMVTHLTEELKRHANELIGRQQVQSLMDNLKLTQPALVDEVVPRVFSLGEVQKVLSNLLRENVSIRDIGTIIETLGDFANITRDADLLTEYVRQRLKRGITQRFVQNNVAHVITLDPKLEQLIMERVRQSENGSYVALEPDVVQKLFNSMKRAIDRFTTLGVSPIVLTSPIVRMHFKKIVEQMAPDLIVLSYNELDQKVEIHSEGLVSV